MTLVNTQISFVVLIEPKDTIAVIQAEDGAGKGERSYAALDIYCEIFDYCYVYFELLISNIF